MANLLFQAIGVTDYGGQNSGINKLGAGPALAPGSLGGNLDIVRTFRWTLTESMYALNEVPYIYLAEYRYLQSQFSAQNTTLSKVPAVAGSAVGASGPDPYAGLYDHSSPSGFTYTIPYFDETMFDANSSWTSIDSGLPSLAATGQALGQAAGGALGAAATAEIGGLGGIPGEEIGKGIGKAIGGAADYLATLPLRLNNPKVGIIDSPKLWKSTSERSYTVQFPLFNTASEADIQRNWELCYLLSYQNLFNKKTYFTAIPPVYYEVLIPGVHYSKASYISHLKIQNKGNIRKLEYDWTGKTQTYNIPDCFIISLTLTDLLMPSQNQMWVAGNSTITTDTAARGYEEQLYNQLHPIEASLNRNDNEPSQGPVLNPVTPG